MLTFPNCKINLGLNIVRKRTDGFHELETVFYPLPVRDALEIIRNGPSRTGYMLSSSGLPVNGEPGDNLCIRAYQLMKHDFPELPPLQIHLHKAIPIGAGLGGGSADGAFTLKLLNEKFGFQLSTEKLLDYSLLLGSDCPFFIINKPCFATGRGELLQRVQLDLSAYTFVLVHPSIHVNTAWAFSQITPSKQATSIKETISQPVESWKQLLVNDFEEPVCRQYPELKDVKEKLYQAGAIYASMTGSGSGFYGIFRKNNVPPRGFLSYNYHILNG